MRTAPNLKIKISGCFNSCGQHHIADIGFFGSVQRKKNDTAPVFQVTLGGSTRNNAESYGLAVGKIPSQNVDKAIVRVTEFYNREKRGDETLSDVVARLGKTRVKQELAEFMELPTFEESPDFYRDIRQPWQYKRSIGVAASARARLSIKRSSCSRTPTGSHFESTLDLERDRFGDASAKAFRGLQEGRRRASVHEGGCGSRTATTRLRNFASTSTTPTAFIGRLPTTSCARRKEGPSEDSERARLRVEEATLFIEAAQGVYSQATDF